MDEDSIEAIRESLRELVTDADGHLSDAALEGFGWAELLEEDDALAVSALFEEIGRVAIRTDALDVLGSASSGEDTVVVVPRRGAPAPIGASGEVVRIDAVAFADVAGRTALLVDPLGDGEILTLDVDAIAATSPEGIDPRARVSVLSGDASVVSSLEPELSGELRHRVALAIAAERLGLARSMLSTAIVHVTDRRQFGHPIGAYQAVQHRLADVHVAIEAAVAAVSEAWRERTPLAALVATAMSAQAAETARTECLQVCGGMGFTEEFALAKPLRRTLLLEGIFGGSDPAFAAVGRAAIAAGAPRIAQFA